MRDFIDRLEAFKASDRPFLVPADIDSGDFPLLTGAEFVERTLSRSAAIQSHPAFSTGSYVYITSGRGLQFWCDVIAVLAVGGVAIPISDALSADERQDFFRIAPPDLEIDHNFPDSEPLDISDLGTISESDTAAILFTSGSTGRRKGVELSRKSLFCNCLATLSRIDLRQDDTLFVPIPYTFTSTINHFLAAFFSGSTFVSTERKLFAANLAKQVVDSGASCFGGSPLQIRWLADAFERDAPALRWVMSSGDHLDIGTIEKYRACMPHSAIYTFYGLTELGGRFCMLPAEKIDASIGAVGTPIPGLTATIRDEAFDEVPTGETGEVFADGELLMKGYLNDPTSTQAALSKHGLRTGDLGYIGNDGQLRLVGRVDDVFKSAGQKVSSLLIRDAIMAQGVFEDFAVLPVEKDMVGLVPWVLYVPRQGQESDIRTMMTSLRDRLPANHLPRGFSEVAEIPRTGSGKLRRKALKEIFDQVRSGTDPRHD